MSTLGMKVKVIVVGSLLMGCAVGFAQGRGGQGAGAQRGGGTASGTRLQDRGRLATHSMDRLQDRTHDRTQDRLHDQDRLRDRDQDRIYGSSLMTAAERAQYEQRLHAFATEQERVQFRMQHEQEMQARAEQKGVTLSPAPTEAQVRAEEQQRQREREQIYGYSMMSPAEVGRYEERLRSARTEHAREQIRAEHRRLMEARARERGDAAPPTG